jgi:uncharacterized membrane protein YkgB
MKSFERELPCGYNEAFALDAKSKKVGLIFNIIALSVALIIALIGFLLFKPYEAEASIWYFVVFFLAIPLYTVCHELLHGLGYKLLTSEKLSFGITLSVAFCGVPNIYVYRKTALISLLLPFSVFLVVFTVPLCFNINDMIRFLISVLLGNHIGGCVGDLFVTGLYLFRFKDKNTLMRDTGPKQTFYVLNKD